MTTNLQSEAAAKVTSLPEGPIEATYLDMVPFYFPTSAIEARLVSSLSRALELTRVPPRVHADRPLEIDLGARGLDAGAGATAFISAHACLAIEIEVTAHPDCFTPNRGSNGGGPIPSNAVQWTSLRLKKLALMASMTSMAPSMAIDRVLMGLLTSF